MASSGAESAGHDVPISNPMSDDSTMNTHPFGDMFHGYKGHGGPRFPPSFAPPFGPHGFHHGMHGGQFHPMHHPPMDPRIYDYSAPPPPPFGGFDPRMHGMHDFWTTRGFGDHDTPRFRPPHPGRPFPPRPFGPPPPPFSDLDLHYHRCPYIQEWWQNAQTCPWMRRSTAGEKPDNKKEFKVTVNVKQFIPEDLNVTVIDGHVKIQGTHEEREDQQGFITRKFIRRYRLPDDVDPGTVKSSLGLGGLLSVFAPRKGESPGEGKAHEVPIEIDPKSPAPEADDSDK